MNVFITHTRPGAPLGKVTIFAVSQKVLTAISRREKVCGIFFRKVKGIKTVASRAQCVCSTKVGSDITHFALSSDSMMASGSRASGFNIGTMQVFK